MTTSIRSLLDWCSNTETIVYIRDSKGHVLGASKVARDISVQKRAEEIAKSAGSVAGVKTEIFVPEVANHVPHLRVTWDASAVGISANDVVKALKDGDPSIGTRNEGPALVIGVWMMRPGEEKIVARRLKQVLEQPAKAKTTAAKG